MTDLLPSYWLSIVPFADLILIMNGGGNTPNAVALFNGPPGPTKPCFCS